METSPSRSNTNGRGALQAHPPGISFRFTASPGTGCLETEMRERLVGFCHPVNFVALLHRAATAFSRFGEFTSQTQSHRLLAALLRGFTQPTHRQCHTTRGTHFDRNLIVRTTNATALHFDHRLHVVERYREHFQRVLATLGLDLFESAVHDALGNRLLAGEHQHVHEFCNINVTELRIRQHFPLGDFATTRHVSSFDFSVGAVPLHSPRGHQLTRFIHYDLPAWSGDHLLDSTGYPAPPLNRSCERPVTADRLLTCQPWHASHRTSSEPAYDP